MSDRICKWRQVESAIRKLIVSGRWKTGSQLPTYEELETRFKVSRITLQQVIRHLKQDGYVTSLERQGLFVSRTPPYLKRIGILVQRDENEVRYWKELVNSARAVADVLGREIVVYRNMETSPDTEKQLEHDIGNHMLSGLIFIYQVEPGKPGYSIYSNSSIPKAVHACSYQGENVMSLHLDNEQLVSRALDYLQEQECSRIALFSNIGSGIPGIFNEEVNSRKIRSPAEWRFQVALQNLDVAEKISHLLMCFPEKERPDGIFVSDDNLASAVIKGIASTRLRIPEDIAIVSHYNWSAGLRDHLQVKSIGFDLKSMMFRIFDAFRLYHETGKLPKTMEEAPLFEEELPENESQAKELAG